MNVEPITRVTLADSVLDQLRKQILSGGLAPGERLPTERELCAAFGVGRTTVREALKGLAATGFVERQGAVLLVRDPRALPGPTVDRAALAARVSVREVFDARRLLEERCAELAAEHASPAELEGLEALLTTMNAVDDAGFPALDVAFHGAIARASHNRVLAQVYEASRALLFRPPSFWEVFPGPDAGAARHRTMAAAKRDHWQIYAALCARDPRAAAAAARAHLDALQAELLRRLDRAAEIAGAQSRPRGRTASLSTDR
ncbi:MAG TPA: FadR/GntR family transcriptional regulator [Chloroflexota bacterium]|nr:FadR/GntR family transcriptional regulator [Chloroflexota bacterium]